MATTPNTLTSSEYWISPDALTIELNALDNPQYLQVSLLAGTVITAFRQGVIDYDASLNYRKWNLQAYNNFFDRTDRAYVYAQLDKNGNNALIIYSYDVLELIETITEDSGETRDVYNVFLATISPSINSNGESVFRTWEKELDTGGLSTDKVSSEWKGFFEKRTDSKGNSYLYTEFNLVSRLGITAYGSSGFEVPSIFDGIPWDNTTIWKNPETGLIEVIGGTGGGSDFDATAMWSALLAATSEQINKSHLTDALSGYALQTSLDAVSAKLNDFLEGSDTDTIINKWKELEAFLSGMAETDNLAEILSNKADTTYVNSELSKYVTLATEQTIDGLKHFTNGLTIGATKHKIYEKDGNILIEGNVLVTGGITAYSEGSGSGGSGGGGIDVELLWEILGGTGTQQINKTHLTTALSGYATESWVTSKNYAVKATTLGGYGITDAYTKSDSDNRFVNVSGDTMTGDLSTKRLTSTDLFIDTGDATLKIYSGYNPNVGYSDGNICFQTSFDRTDGQNHEYPTSYPSRCNILLQPRGGQVYIGINPNEGNPYYKLFVNGRIYSTAGFIKEGSSDSYLLLGGGGHKHFSDFMLRKDGAAPDSAEYGFGYWNGIGSYISFAASGWGGQLKAQGEILYYRYIANSKPKGWHQIAKITDNVASATKLQTPRTIWGQSFDGTEDVSGALTGVTTITANGESKFSNGTYADPAYGIPCSIKVSQNFAVGSNCYLATLSGNVGIGTASPAYKLDVSGDIHASGWLRTTGNVGWYSQNHGGGIWMTEGTYVRVYNNKAFLVENANHYAFNSRGGYYSNWNNSFELTDTNTLNYTLATFNKENTTVNHGTVQPQLVWGNQVSGYGYITRYSISSIRPTNDGWGRMRLAVGASDGGDRIGCYLDIDGDGIVTVGGNFLATGGITCYASDQRAKTVIEQISLSLKQIANAPTIRFKWNNWKIKDDGKTHIGGIAQYMQKLLPETVLEADNMLNMDYATTGYIFAVQTARHLQMYETRTDKELRRLKKRVSYLEKQLKQLGYEETDIIPD